MILSVYMPHASCSEAEYDQTVFSIRRIMEKGRKKGARDFVGEDLNIELRMEGEGGAGALIGMEKAMYNTQLLRDLGSVLFRTLECRTEDWRRIFARGRAGGREHNGSTSITLWDHRT